MVLAHRKLLALSVIVAMVGVGLIVAAFATDHWITSSPKGNDTVHSNGTVGSASGYTANITFGLFTGYKLIDFGIGPRPSSLALRCNTSVKVCAYASKDDGADYTFANMVQDFKNQSGANAKSMEWFGLFSFPLYVATLTMLVLAIVWGLVAIGFGVFNVFGRPIETITGPAGLYVWNFLALLFSAAAIGVYLGLYFTQLKVNLLTVQELTTFTSKDLTYLDMSFYFVVGAAGAFLLNLFVLLCSGQKCSCSYSRSGEKEVDSGMILY